MNDYTIIALRRDHTYYNSITGSIESLSGNGNYLATTHNEGWNVLRMERKSGRTWNIWSVRRDTDGEVLSIGYETKEGKIDEFKFDYSLLEKENIPLFVGLRIDKYKKYIPLNEVKI